MTNAQTIEIIEQCGGNRWTRGEYDRMYFNDLEERVGLKIDTYKSAHIAHATLNGETISNGSARRICATLAGVNVWYDLRKHALMANAIDINNDYVQTAIRSIQDQLCEHGVAC